MKTVWHATQGVDLPHRHSKGVILNPQVKDLGVREWACHAAEMFRSSHDTLTPTRNCWTLIRERVPR